MIEDREFSNARGIHGRSLSHYHTVGISLLTDPYSDEYSDKYSGEYSDWYSHVILHKRIAIATLAITEIKLIAEDVPKRNVTSW
jgi:hypothetical protein